MQAAVRMAGLRSPGLVRCRVQLRRHSSSGGGGGGGGSPRKAPSEQPSSGEPDTAFRAGSRAAIEQLEKIARGEAKSRFSVADYALLGFPAVLCCALWAYQKGTQFVAFDAENSAPKRAKIFQKPAEPADAAVGGIQAEHARKDDVGSMRGDAGVVWHEEGSGVDQVRV